MKAFITSINEPTTKLCQWSLERNGFETVLVEDRNTSLWEKLNTIYELAEDDFVRVDADIIVNRNFNPTMLSWLDIKDKNIWWWQFITFDLLKLDTNHSMAFIRKEALPFLRKRIEDVIFSSRPETELSRIKEFYEPRRFATFDTQIMGLHGYKADLNRAKKLKHIRNQQDLYDFDLAERLQAL